VLVNFKNKSKTSGPVVNTGYLEVFSSQLSNYQNQSQKANGKLFAVPVLG
jgi:hypothetical protein